MLILPLLLNLLLLEVPPYLLNPLLLQHLLHLGPHGRHLSILIHLVLIDLRVLRQLGQDAQGVILLSRQVHQGTLLCLQVFRAHFVLSKHEIFLEHIFVLVSWLLLLLSGTH